jgi:Ca-activated chloride channel homolog
MSTAMAFSQGEQSNGGRMVTTDGKTLPLRSAELRVEARGGIARTILSQRYVNPYDVALAITYLMPLPADGAVSGYAFTIGERRIAGEVDKRASARQRFEQAIASGQTAAIVDEERSSLFTQELGNVPPRAEIVAELTIDQKLMWLDEGAWEWRFPTVAMPRYQGAPGRVEDVARVTVDVADAPLPATMTLSLRIGDRILDGRRAESPSHALHINDGMVGLAAEGARLDRDFVVRWPVATREPGVSIDVARPAADKAHQARAYALLTLVPPSPSARKLVARDLCFLIDTSGSMGGEPLAQARRVLTALVDTLCDDDTLQMIEFSSRPRAWKHEAVRATEGARSAAKKWIGKLEAGGATEMRDGLMQALAPLRPDSQRQIVLVSDGAIGFEAEIVRDVLALLPPGSRLHTVGVGSGVNRSLTMPAARAGRGVEVIIGIGEDPERAARRIVARTSQPVVVDLRVAGAALVGCAPARLPDLFGGAPALLSLALDPAGGELVITGRTADGKFEQRLSLPPCAHGHGNAALTALYGRETIEDLEMRRLAAGAHVDEVDAQIEKIGIDFQISSRLTSWVAIDSEVSVDPTRPTRRERVPQELPYGVSVAGLGLRSAAMAHPLPPGSLGSNLPPPAPAMPVMRSNFAMDGSAASGAGGAQRTRSMVSAPSAKTIAPAPSEPAKMKKGFTRGGGGGEGGGGIELRGEATLLSDRELIVKVEVTAALAWTLPAEVTLVDIDGNLVTATILPARSTATGHVNAGETIRLYIMLPQPFAARPSAIVVGEQLRIVV